MLRQPRPGLRQAQRKHAREEGGKHILQGQQAAAGQPTSFRHALSGSQRTHAHAYSYRDIQTSQSTRVLRNDKAEGRLQPRTCAVGIDATCQAYASSLLQASCQGLIRLSASIIKTPTDVQHHPVGIAATMQPPACSERRDKPNRRRPACLFESKGQANQKEPATPSQPYLSCVERCPGGHPLPELLIDHDHDAQHVAV